MNSYDTSSEQHRHACEVRLVASWPRDRRVRFYHAVANHRGEEAARRLIRDVSALLKGNPDKNEKRKAARAR